MKSSPKKELGAAMVEFVIVALLLFLVLFGIISYGFMLYDQAVITNASREGARAGVASIISAKGYTSTSACTTPVTISVTTTANAQTTAQCIAQNYIASTALIRFGAGTPPTYTISSAGTCAPPAQLCSLTVTINYPFVGVWGISHNLTATTRMYYE